MAALLTTRWRLAAFLLGGALFAFLLYHAGPAELAANLKQAGWVLLPVCLLWIPIYLCRTAAWQLTMGGTPGPTPPFWRTFVIAIITFAVNLVTPFVQAGGEVLRVKAIAPWMGSQRAAGSTVTYYMLHALSNLALWVAGIAAALLWVPLPAAWSIAFAVSAVVILALGAFVLSRHDKGVVAPLAAVLAFVPVAGPRLTRRLEAHRGRIEELDAIITGFYRHAPGRFWLALLIDAAGRVIALAEYWFIARGVGLELSLLQTFVIGALGALTVNVIFFVPLEAGVKEGGFFIIFQLLGLDPALGVFTALVQRLREFAWIAIGLLLIPLSGAGRTADEAGRRPPEI